MSNKRQSRRANGARGHARKSEKTNSESTDNTTFTGIIRRALREHPVALLSLASMTIHLGRPDALTLLKSGGHSEGKLDASLTGLIGVCNRETTALLAVLAELLVDDPAAQMRCRQELAQRSEHVPRWIAVLPQAEAYRAVRRTDIFGDVDELVVGVRLHTGHELTVAVSINHNMWSHIDDAAAVQEPIEAALARVNASSRDTRNTEMRLSDARAWIDEALSKSVFVPKEAQWPAYRALIQWLLQRLPEGGERRSSPTDWDVVEELCDGFFATESAAPFTDFGHRELLPKLLETGSGDALRWSVERVEAVLCRRPYSTYASIPLEVSLDTPDLLHAFIPYAHAQSGIRDELTLQVLRVINQLRSVYKRDVLRESRLDVDDAV